MRLKQRAAHVPFRRRSSAFVLGAIFSYGETHIFNIGGGQTVAVLVIVVVVVVVVAIAVVVVAIVIVVVVVVFVVVVFVVVFIIVIVVVVVEAPAASASAMQSPSSCGHRLHIVPCGDVHLCVCVCDICPDGAPADIGTS